jgi:hypothetical protein
MPSHARSHSTASAYSAYSAREIGVVEAQNEPPGPAPGEQPVQQRGAGVADVDAPVGEGAQRTIGVEDISSS